MSWAPCEEPDCTPTTDLPTVQWLIRPSAKNIGAFNVRRSLPVKECRSVGPFVFFDEMGPADLGPSVNMDVRPHPHVNLATITYLFEGVIMHRDSLGYEQAIEPGAVNLMVAGRGIVHSERTPVEQRGVDKRMHGLQLWMGLPEASEETEPSFEHHPASTIPEWQEGSVRCRLIMGKANGHTSPVTTFSETLYLVGSFEDSDAFRLPEASQRAIYLMDGQTELDGTLVEAGTMAVLHPGSVVARASAGTRFALIGGDTLGPRYLWWNFVSSRRERIEEAKEAWRSEAFATIEGDSDERIPLPE